MLEPCEGRLSRAVLRGRGASNGSLLPDSRLKLKAGVAVGVVLHSEACCKPAQRVRFIVSAPRELGVSCRVKAPAG
jgi:hypothetical protein